MFSMLRVALLAGAGAGVAYAGYQIFKKFQCSSDVADKAVDEAVPEESLAEENVTQPGETETIAEATVNEVNEVIPEVTKVAPADNVDVPLVTETTTDASVTQTNEVVPEETVAELQVAEYQVIEAILKAAVNEVNEVIPEITEGAPADNVGVPKVTNITFELPVNEVVPEISVAVPTPTETVSEAAQPAVCPEVTDVECAANAAIFEVSGVLSEDKETIPESSVAIVNEPTVAVDTTKIPLKKKKKEAPATQRARVRRLERRRLERMEKENLLAQEHADPIDPEFPFLGPIKFEFLQPSQLE